MRRGPSRSLFRGTIDVRALLTGILFSLKLKLPPNYDLWSCFVDCKLRRFELWERLVPKFDYNKNEPFFNCLVPTVDTFRYGKLLELLFSARQSILFTGDTGVGKVSGCSSSSRLNHLLLFPTPSLLDCNSSKFAGISSGER